MSATDHPSDPTGAEPGMRASRLLKIRAVWIVPVMLTSVLIFLMTLIYVGSVVDPLAHLHGLPALVVDEDVGANVLSKQVDIGQEVVSALEHATAVSSRLALDSLTLSQAKARMDVDGAYATIVIPRDFSASTLALYGVGPSAGGGAAIPTIQLLTNPRAGSIGVSLATGVLMPALAAISLGVGHHLSTISGVPSETNTVVGASQANPITVKTVPYRPLPPTLPSV